MQFIVFNMELRSFSLTQSPYDVCVAIFKQLILCWQKILN